MPENVNRGEFYIREGCFITELCNSADDDAVSVARARVEPGITTRWHVLDGITERYIILEGVGHVEIGETPGHTLAVGEVVIIPPGQRQRITNTGDGDLVFLAVCTPRFTPEQYREV